MSISDKIRILCARLNISKAELARRIGQSPQSFSGKMKRESFTVSDLEEIAAAAGVKFVHKFTLDSGEEI
jgi:transcriptional regulator with XRE-family HTH domain